MTSREADYSCVWAMLQSSLNVKYCRISGSRTPGRISIKWAKWPKILLNHVMNNNVDVAIYSRYAVGVSI